MKNWPHSKVELTKIYGVQTETPLPLYVLQTVLQTVLQDLIL